MMPDYGAPTARNSLVSFARKLEGTLEYSQSNRNIAKGSGDCSSFTAYCYKTVLGIDIGSYTGEQIQSGTEADTSTSASRIPNIKKLKPGDLLFYRSKSSGYTRGVGHVELYIGDGVTLGHGGGTGPKRKNASSYRTDNSAGNYYICARRIINSGEQFDIPSKYVVKVSDTAAENDEYYSENAYGSDGEPTVIWTQRTARTASAQLTAEQQLEYNGFCIYAGGYDVTAYTGDITFAGTSDGICETLTMTIGKTDNQYLKDLIHLPFIGDVVSAGCGEERFRGIITSVDDGDLYKNTYTVSDMGYYIAKTEETYQFTDMRADMALRTIFEDLNIPCAYICDMPEAITNIYFDKSIKDIINDIFTAVGGGFCLDFVPDGVRVYREGEWEIVPTYTAAKNIPPVNAFLTAHDMSHTQTIDDMYNAVKVVSNSDNVYEELKTAFDHGNIEQYGFMQKIVSIDTQKENPDEVGERELEALNRQTESLSISIYCDMEQSIRAGCRVTYGSRSYIVRSAQSTVCEDKTHLKTALELI